MKSSGVFSDLSYLSQVRSLRGLAQELLKSYSLGAYKLTFIHHGENATFKVTTSQGKKYLLRIHRYNYHSHGAIKEEIKWLKSVGAQTDIKVQKPIKSKNGRYVEKLSTAGVGDARYCVLFSWVDGSIRRRALNGKDFYKLGVLTAKLHQSAKKISIKHRTYWGSHGLMGVNSTFGKTTALKGPLGKNYEEFNDFRKIIFKRLRKYETKFPHKSSLIHADLHFGNVLWSGGQVSPIDFDDCGFGLQMYDLAVTGISAERLTKIIGLKGVRKMKGELYSGYESLCEISPADRAAIADLELARTITMITWLNARSDNPRLRAYFKKAVKTSMGILRKNISIK